MPPNFNEVAPSFYYIRPRPRPNTRRFNTEREGLLRATLDAHTIRGIITSGTYHLFTQCRTSIPNPAWFSRLEASGFDTESANVPRVPQFPGWTRDLRPCLHFESTPIKGLQVSRWLMRTYRNRHTVFGVAMDLLCYMLLRGLRVGGRRLQGRSSMVQWKSSETVISRTTPRRRFPS